MYDKRDEFVAPKPAVPVVDVDAVAKRVCKQSADGTVLSI
jgi:hypothetical protein